MKAKVFCNKCSIGNSEYKETQESAINDWIEENHINVVDVKVNTVPFRCDGSDWNPAVLHTIVVLYEESGGKESEPAGVDGELPSLAEILDFD